MTPLYKITYRYQNLTKKVLVKDESKNITGSIKYRPAKYMIDKAYELKLINQSTPLIEVTSGNMGIALARVAKEHGNKMIIYMPKNMSKERIEMIKKEGAELILTKDFDEAFTLAEQAKGYYVRQFENQYNADSYIALCQELESKLKVYPAFIAGVGTSGTLTGVGTYLKKKYQSKIIALEPKESLLFSTGVNHGSHEIQGLSDGFIPKLYKNELVDQVVSISSVDAIKMAQKIKAQLKVEVGISSGANLLGAILTKIDNIITVFPDSIDRYYSTRLMNQSLKSEIVDQIELIKIEAL